MKKILILHAWYNNPGSNWYPWLENELEKKSCQVLLPELPTMNTDLPDLKVILKYIQPMVDKDTIIIGHSLGGVLALRLGEEQKLKQIITIAAWDYDDLYPEHQLFWKNKINHQAIIRNVKDIIIIHSDNDPFLTAFQSENMSKRLMGKFILTRGAGHFTAKDGITKIPQVLKLL